MGSSDVFTQSYKPSGIKQHRVAILLRTSTEFQSTPNFVTQNLPQWAIGIQSIKEDPFAGRANIFIIMASCDTIGECCLLVMSGIEYTSLCIVLVPNTRPFPVCFSKLLDISPAEFLE